MKYIALIMGCALACGGSAESGPEPFGWCCEGFCGLTGRDTEYFDTCTCDGAEQAAVSGRGDCVELAE